MPTKFDYVFIHNVFSHFFRMVLDYFVNIFPRFNYTMLGTYDKAVAYLTSKDELGREMDKPNLPALILNPLSNIETADTGRQLFRFPNLAPSMAKRVFEPIFQDENVLITVGFARVRGHIDILALLNSFYELCDFRMALLNNFNGLNRVVYADYYHSFIILPDEIYNYEYNNTYTGQKYKIDWGSYVKSDLIKTINKDKFLYPFQMRPWLLLSSMDESGSRYGGVDKLSDYRLSCSVEYEMYVPTFMILETDYLAGQMSMDVSLGYVYSVNSFKPPEMKLSVGMKYDYGLSVGKDSPYYPENVDVSLDYSKIMTFHNRYYYVVRPTDATSESDLVIVLPEVVPDDHLIMVNSIAGLLKRGDHWLFDNNSIIIRRDRVELKENMIIEIFIYRY